MKNIFLLILLFSQLLLAQNLKLYSLPAAGTLASSDITLLSSASGDSSRKLAIGQMDQRWAPYSLPLTDGYLYIGNSLNVATGRLMSGDASINPSGDFTLATVTTSGTYASISVNAKGLVTSGAASLDLTTKVSGTLPIGNGGTGLTTYTKGELLYSSAANTVGKIPAVASGQVLISNGVSQDPSYSANPSVTSITTTTSNVSGFINLTGGQIKFPATQAASSDANVMDDYEKGTFNPAVIGTSTAGTGTYTNQLGWYTKIGNRVLYVIRFGWSGHTGTGNISINGLPFTSNSTSGNDPPCATYADGLTLAASSYLTAVVNSNTATISLINNLVGGGGATSVAMDTVVGTLLLSGQYQTQ